MHCSKESQMQREDLTIEVGRRKLTSFILGRILCMYSPKSCTYRAIFQTSPFIFFFPLSLHVACGVGASTRVIKMLLSSYPEATMMKTQKGSSPQQCLNLTLCKNKDEVLKLLKRHYRKVDEKYKPAAKPDSDRVLV